MSLIISGGGNLFVTSGLKFMPLRLGGRATSVCGLQLFPLHRQQQPPSQLQERSVCLTRSCQVRGQRVRHDFTPNSDGQTFKTDIFQWEVENNENLLEKLEKEAERLNQQQEREQKKVSPPTKQTYSDGSHTIHTSYPEEIIRDRTFRNEITKIKDSVKNVSVTVDNRFELIQRIMTPFKDLTYEEELLLKEQKNEEITFKILAKAGQYSCRVHPTVASPVQDGYRSKSEFSIHRGVDGNEKTVGFFIGSKKDGVICVEPEHVSTLRQ